jgi:hypothetical protein
LLFQLFFFLTTRIDLSEQQFKLTLVPSGDEQAVEAGSTVISRPSPVYWPTT